MNKILLENLIEQITANYEVKKIIIFGSWARGNNRINSDIDIAVSFKGNISTIRNCVEENVRTLLKFDIVDYDKLPYNLKKEIDNDGVVAYEKNRTNIS